MSKVKGGVDNLNTKKVMLELARAEFNRSRLRVYYGNIGELIAQENLRRQGFEVWLPRPIAEEKDYLSIFHLPEMIDEERLRRHYELHLRTGTITQEDTSWEEYLSQYKEHIMKERKQVKASIAFFGDQLHSFQEYLKRLKSESIEYHCDLIAKRDEKIYLIEVKSTKRARQFLKGEKMRGLMLAKEYGFFPAVVTMNLKIEALSFEMEEL